jgi:hypothetical protein
MVAGEAVYSITLNALMARRHGLDWTVATDHGGPNHSRISLEWAYPELQLSRRVVPALVQFFGMELDTPGADHSSLIIPHFDEEAQMLHELEHGFNRREPWPPDPAWDTEARMIEALTYMQQLDPRPVLIANHPSRSAIAIGAYGLVAPEELRDWNDAAPEVAVGMAGAPGHQARSLHRDGTINPFGVRGAYARAPTMGGFDQMTARLGGFWDSMLGEGRRWWITANSDSHMNWRAGGSDFWPGEYSKTYVLAEKTHDDILAALRAGRVFVTTGDLISELWLTAETVADASGSAGGTVSATIGGALQVARGSDVRVTIRVLDPEGDNHRGDAPRVRRVDLIVGGVQGVVADRTSDTNPTTRVFERFGPRDWDRDGVYWTMTTVLEDVPGDLYVRVRGTNTGQLEPELDPRGENPWDDLWFYSNPIFIEVAERP